MSEVVTLVTAKVVGLYQSILHEAGLDNRESKFSNIDDLIK